MYTPEATATRNVEWSVLGTSARAPVDLPE